MVEDPLATTGVIGDRRSAALVRAGDITWWCPTRFDAPSVCAGVLDPIAGGRFHLAPADGVVTRTAYEGDTNVLVTEWEAPSGHLVVHDLMPLSAAGAPAYAPGSILRIARCTGGSVTVRLSFAPRPGYGVQRPQATRAGPQGAVLRSPSCTLSLAASRAVQVGVDDCSGQWGLDEGQAVSVAVCEGQVKDLQDAKAVHLLESTRQWWEAWIGRCAYKGAYRASVRRSALVLELLRYAPTGGLVAAVTTSLPEWPGGPRNWDYRYVWLRDAAFAVDAFKDVGHEESALRLGAWIDRVLAHKKDDLEILYTVDGSPGPEERILRHLSSAAPAPVRVGNAAAGQFQLDVYGELVECLHLIRLLTDDEHEERDWPQVRQVIERVRRRWHEPDHGIWEMRDQKRHHVLSKALAWVALDRGVQAVRDLGVEGPSMAWAEEADKVRASVFAHGLDRERNAFVQAYGSTDMDAANLLLPILGFIDPDDPRMRGTVKAIREDLEVDGLVYRYRTDDGAGPQAPFTACSFWLVEALTQMGHRDEAHTLMERLLRQATPLGLYAQNLDPRGRHLGNFPQGLSHIALTSAAIALQHADRHQAVASPHLAHMKRGWASGAR